MAGVPLWRSVNDEDGTETDADAASSAYQGVLHYHATAAAAAASHVTDVPPPTYEAATFLRPRALASPPPALALHAPGTGPQEEEEQEEESVTKALVQYGRLRWLLETVLVWVHVCLWFPLGLVFLLFLWSGTPLGRGRAAGRLGWVFLCLSLVAFVAVTRAVTDTSTPLWALFVLPHVVAAVATIVCAARYDRLEHALRLADDAAMQLWLRARRERRN
jgi:hypothetical protein